MADPLSAAGTAVGIISLGLQVSQGLITYYSHFKSFHEDIANITRSLEMLRGILQCLDEPLRRAEVEESDVPEQVRNSVAICKDGILVLHRAVTKYDSTAVPVSRREKASLVMGRIAYPFKKETLFGLQSRLQELQTHLGLAVGILDLQVSQSHKEQAISRLDAFAAQEQLNSENLSKRFDQLVLQDRTNLHQNQYLQSSLCEEGEQLTMAYQQASQTRRRAAKQHSRCSCPSQPQYSASHLYLWNLSAFWSHTTRHLPHCRFSRYSQRLENILGIKYTYCTKMLGFSVAATLSVARGAGGLAISPHFMLRAVVPKDSPAFRLLDFNAWNSDGGFRNPIEHANWIIQQLAVLFRDGKASPTDTLPSGKTLLHVSMNESSDFEIRSNRGKCSIETVNRWIDENYTILPEQIQATSRLLDGILGFGANPLERDCTNSSYSKPNETSHYRAKVRHPRSFTYPRSNLSPE
ncbi:hypothetical protein BKA65DRAFT_75918 [Rhexocercosporidium sp. MPI-PUGE-AT-0058]|nr:hypothetical protein BKA65DRAFT_75918 [Rhexocercosporidium sp. MPI-PUGE-AT-0058]